LCSGLVFAISKTKPKEDNQTSQEEKKEISKLSF
jgi:hypothetical protein